MNHSLPCTYLVSSAVLSIRLVTANIYSAAQLSARVVLEATAYKRLVAVKDYVTIVNRLPNRM